VNRIDQANDGRLIVRGIEIPRGLTQVGTGVVEPAGVSQDMACSVDADHIAPAVSVGAGVLVVSWVAHGGQRDGDGAADRAIEP
jgi:hypothetical protein